MKSRYAYVKEFIRFSVLQVLCKETVTATTNCTGYVVSKYDMFNRLPRDHHQYILESLKKLEAPKSYLWDTTPHPMTEEDWKIQSVWTSYRKDVLKSFYHPLTNRTPSILAKSKLIEKKIYVPTNHKPAEDTTEFDVIAIFLFFIMSLWLICWYYFCGLQNVSTTSSISVEDKAEELTSMAVGIPSPNAKGRKDFNRKMKDQTKISRPSSAINEIRVHDEEWDKFEIVDQATEIDIHESLSAHNDKQVNFSHKQIGSMSFGDSPPGSPHSNRPDSRGGGSPDSAKGRKDLQPLPLQALQEPLKRQHFALPPSMGTMRNFSVQNSKYIDGSAPQGIGTLKSFAASNVFRPPFCLIQLHREKLKMRPIQGSRRLLKCYFRVCGLVGTCNEAKLAAESQMLNISMRFKAAGSDSSGHYSGRTTTLNWNRFSGFATMPLQNTDHFLIYCRGSPIEFASFTPPIGVDLLDAPFPSACKPTGQHFACLSVYRISAPRPSIVLYGEDDLQDLHKNEVDDPLAKPLLMKEMSAIVEAMGTTPSRLDALRYAFSLTEQSELAANAQPELVSAVVKAARWSTTPDPKALASLNTPDGVNAPQRLITVPLYVWLHISEDTFRFYDHADFTTEELSSEDRFISIMRNRIIPRQDMAISVSELNAANIGFKVSSTGGSPNKTKSVSEELKDAIASVGQVLNDGVNKMNTTNESRGCAKEGKRGVPSLHRAASTNVLKNERTNRVLISTVENRLRHLGTEESTFSTDLMSSASGSSLNTSADQPPPKVGFKKTISETSSIEFKIKALKDNIATRQRVLSLSDELCKIETKLKLEQAATKPRAAKLAIEQKSVITYDLDGELAADDNYMQTRMTPADLKVAQKRLVEKRLEIFDALQGVPHNKFYSEAGDLGHKTATIGKLSVALRASDNHRSLHSSVASDQTSKKNGNNVSSLMRKKLNALETVSTTITS